MIDASLLKSGMPQKQRTILIVIVYLALAACMGSRTTSAPLSEPTVYEWIGPDPAPSLQRLAQDKLTCFQEAERTDTQKAPGIKLRGERRPGAGRPRGAPNKITRPVKELAAQHTEGSIHTLVRLRDYAESEQVRLQAATTLLDRGHGRPRQELDVTQNNGVRVFVYGPEGMVRDVPPALEYHSRAEE